MSRMIALAFAAITLAACEQRDKGADVAACQLEELKSNYPEKVSLERELEKAANIDQSREYFKMLKSKKFEFLRLCMRVKGWDAKPETSCLQQYLDQANCYVRASGIGD